LIKTENLCVFILQSDNLNGSKAVLERLKLIPLEQLCPTQMAYWAKNQ